MAKLTHLGWVLGITMSGALWANGVGAQILGDGTLPNNSVVTRNGSTINVTGGTQAGGNLFHSFQEFSVPDGAEAIFNNALDIQNIISRVTGGSRSNIDGLIRTLGSANLLFINPNGIIFGPSARLNVGGSFVASTASAIQFGEQGFFSADLPTNNTPLLTVNPSALFFNQIAEPIQNNSVALAGSDPAGIQVFGLRVPDGKSLLLIGGNINMDRGRLNAYGGRIELSGLADSGTVALNVDGDNLSARFPTESTLADVSLTNGARVNVRASGGGNITVKAQNLDITNGSVLSAGIGQGLGTVGTVAGDVVLNATGEIKVVGSNVFNDVQPEAVGDGGNITINSGSFSLLDGARLQASTFGQGKAGNVTVRATDAVSLANNAYIFSTVEAGGFGKGGDININAATLSLIDGARLAAITRRAPATAPAGQVDAGNVNVNVSGAVSLAGVKNGIVSAISSSVETRTVGNAGNITINSGSLSLRDSAQLLALTLGQGKAGNVTVRATDAVSLAGASIRSIVEAGGIGKGGDIDINAATLSLIDGAQLLTLTSSASATAPAGLGDAGNVNVNVTGAVNIAGVKNGFRSGISSSVEAGTVGNGGNITINSGSFSLLDGAGLAASTLGQGKAGNVTVRATDAVSLAGASILSTVEAGGVGKGGNININAPTLSLIDGAQLQTLTRSATDTAPAGLGDAGNVNVNVSGMVNIAGEKNGSRSGILSSVGAGTVGNGGNITINSGSLSLRDGAQLSASTRGQGKAGNVTVRATDAVFMANNAYIFSTVEAGGFGKGGDIDINAATLSLIDGALLLTFIRSATDTAPAGLGDAGNVNVNVSGMVNIAGEKNGFGSGISSFMGTGTVGNGGNITINSGSLSLRDGAELSASTFGQGKAGNVTVRATDAVFMANNAYIFSTVEAGGFGKGGDIDINAASLSLIDGGQLLTFIRRASATAPAGLGDAGNVNVNVSGMVNIAGEKNGFRSGINSFVDTGTVGNGGNITINSGSLSLLDGAGLVASTLGQGNAGTIKVNATDFATISGRSSNFNSGLFVNSQSTTGTTGDIIVTAPQILLDNTATINAESESGNGGNINLQTDLLLMRRGAQISTNAGITAQRGGNGGNITITAPKGFIIAVPRENSDITANAYTGAGGRVNINASGIYGIQQRQNQTSFSDITASSEFGVAGTIELITPEVDPNSGLVELPTVPVDTEVAQGCYTPGYAQSSFVITGRGGLPPNPKDILTPDTAQIDWVSIKPRNNNRPLPPVTIKPASTTPKPIVEATGATLNAKGQIVLTANSSTVTPSTSKQNLTQCHSN
ncbi:filamentous hemagglutinin N-terminal domain-containing protein [Iningainema tapete]|uniref:Filamentous hemagglutinin N-terminal domain-containing protein n=1 Tax=Iningainema tapete BLCC-T55 TaxID=2748662 RepID=A0A8J7C5R3_9CYAN|nr:filamentous hemagglutinin N-terminal domain-containing protein [Iningainema tapete]MBD2771106.1 filamentous hemagglutinin N-terminal domain-containing protein [Iningainema tapete BLCC-T55]